MYIHGRSILAGRFSCGNCKQRGDVPSQACSHIPLKKGWLTFHPKRAGPRYKKNVWLGSKPRRHPNAGLARQLYSTKPTVSHGCKMRPGPKWCVAWSKTWNLPARFFWWRRTCASTTIQEKALARVRMQAFLSASTVPPLPSTSIN